MKFQEGIVLYVGMLKEDLQKNSPDSFLCTMENDFWAV